jgi:hypothetical protein
MKHQLPVVYDGKRYTIAEYVLWYQSGKRMLSVGLVAGNTLIRVLADKVELEEV